MKRKELLQKIIDRDFSGNHSRFIQDVNNNIDWAWQNWNDDTLKVYVTWEGEKPESYPDEFARQWIGDEPFEYGPISD